MEPLYSSLCYSRQAGTNITNLLADLDHLLSSNDRFLVGRWIADAKSWGTDFVETALLEYNARNQITLWGPTGEVLFAAVYCLLSILLCIWLLDLSVGEEDNVK